VIDKERSEILFIAYFSVPCLDMVETAPRMMSSTPRGMGRS